MDSRAQLEQSAADVYRNAITVTNFSEFQGFPQRSFEDATPVTLLPNDAPPSIRVAKQKLKEATTRIQQLVCDPSEFIGSFQIEYQQLACLRWLCHFNITSYIPLTHSVPYEMVATNASVPLRQLISIVRMAITRNFLREPVPGEVGHSNISAAFVENPSFRDWALFMAGTSAEMAMKTVEATEKYGTTNDKTQTTYNVWRNTDKPFFDDIKQSKERMAQFANYMKNVTSGQATNIRHLVSNYDWASLGSVTIVDLGGSNGHASIALASEFPNLKFIVQDLNDVIESSKPNLDSLPALVAERITYQPHDFFSRQPLEDVDVFLLRMIIHDWPVAEATDILRNLIGSLKPTGKLIIMDTMLPQPGSVPVAVEAALRVRDMTMMQTHNSKEREFDEWVALIKSVDCRLKINGVKQPFESSMAIIEVVWDHL